MVNYWCLGNSCGADSSKCEALEYDNLVAVVSLWVGGWLAGGQEVAESLPSVCWVTTCLLQCKICSVLILKGTVLQKDKPMVSRSEWILCHEDIHAPGPLGVWQGGKKAIIFQWTENKIARTSFWLSSCKESDHFSCAIYIVTTHSSQSVNQSFSAKVST